MKATIKHVEEGVLLVSDQPLFADLEDGTEVEISEVGDSFTIVPISRLEGDDRFRAAADKVLEQHSGLFKRLADS